MTDLTTKLINRDMKKNNAEEPSENRGWGGARRRSGRRPLPEDQRRVPLGCTLDPLVHQGLTKLYEADEAQRPMGHIVDELLEENPRFPKEDKAD